MQLGSEGALPWRGGGRVHAGANLYRAKEEPPDIE